MDTQRNGINTDRGHEIVGPRITVYHVYYYLVNGWSKSDILAILPITSEQFDRAVHYISEHRQAVEAVHQQIEERNARGNSPEVRARLEQSHHRFQQFKEWLSARKKSKTVEPLGPNGASGRPLATEFKRWLAAQEANDGGRR